MKKNLGSKNWMFPMPVLMIGTYGEDGTPDVMNAAWGGITLEDEITICIDTSHKTRTPKRMCFPSLMESATGPSLIPRRSQPGFAGNLRGSCGKAIRRGAATVRHHSYFRLFCYNNGAMRPIATDIADFETLRKGFYGACPQRLVLVAH